MRRRSNAGLFQRLLEAGSRTTYHGKIRTRGGRKQGTVRAGKQSLYEGVRIIPVGNGEFETSLDSSRFESKRDARRFVDSWKKGRENPVDSNFAHLASKAKAVDFARKKLRSGYRWAEVHKSSERKHKGKYRVEYGTSQFMPKGLGFVSRNPDRMKREYFRTRAEADRYAKKYGGHVGVDGSGYFVEYLETLRVHRAPGKRNPRGHKGDFARCVEAVSQRKGAKDPNAICAASERKRGLINPTIYQALAQKLGREPSNAELRAEVQRIKEAALVEAAGKGKLGFQRRRNTRNPAASAQAVSEEFHGRPVREMVPVQQKRHYHKYLAELGELRKLEVLAQDGKHRVTLTKFDHAMLCTNEHKNQLFITGGDQSVNLKDFGIKDPHETETLGQVTKIEYFTDKEHLGSEGGAAVYVHKFRTTNGNRGHKTVRMARNPDLIYYLRDEHLEFSGGSYFIRAEGIDQ